MSLEERVSKLDSLNQMVKCCRQCTISERRNHIVFGNGDAMSPLLIIGEGPGQDEDDTGRPFEGKSGKMLDLALILAGLSRTEVFVVNTVKCRACDWINAKPKNRPPTKLELENCRKWLDQQIEILDPKVILCVGGTSAKSLLGSTIAVTSIRGKLLDLDEATVRKVVVTLHPAFIMRGTNVDKEQKFNQLVNDVRLAWQTANSSN